MRERDEILVTGGEGFVGRHLVPELDARGYTVRVLSRSDGDIANCDLVFPRVRHVFHLAGKMFVPESWADPGPFYSTNVLGVLNVLELCRRNHASLTLLSSYVYGQPQCLPISEKHPIDAFNPYAHTKILAEQTAQFYMRHFGLRITIIRPFNLFGPGQKSPFLIPTILRQALDPATDAIRVADKRPRRDYLYIEDFVALLNATLEMDSPGIYNAGSGMSSGIEEIVAVIGEVTGKKKPLVSDDIARPGEVLDVVADISLAASKLRWTPQVSLREGITAILHSSQPFLTAG